MAEFKKNPPTILKDKRVAFDSRNGGASTDYWHATLGNVAQAITEGLARVGISHSWTAERKGDRIHVACTLTHQAGHSESISLDGPLDNSGNKNAIQQMASTTTYLSRYTLLLITGLAVKDEIDDDGRSGATAGRSDDDQHQATPRVRDTAQPKTYDGAKFAINLPAWQSVIQPEAQEGEPVAQLLTRPSGMQWVEMEGRLSAVTRRLHEADGVTLRPLYLHPPKAGAAAPAEGAASPTEAQLLALVLDNPGEVNFLMPRQREAALNRGRERYAAFMVAAPKEKP